MTGYIPTDEELDRLNPESLIDDRDSVVDCGSWEDDDCVIIIKLQGRIICKH